MKKRSIYFIKEIKRHYTKEFFIAFFIVLLLLLLPLFKFKNHLKFDYKEFANIYLSAVFSALLIGLVLQIIELFKSSTATYIKSYNIVLSINSTLKTITEKISKDEKNISVYSNLLEHYKKGIENSFTSDNETNEILLNLYRSEELAYLIESLKIENITPNKKTIILERCNILLDLTNYTLDQL